jgi:hypothetical protein
MASFSLHPATLREHPVAHPYVSYVAPLRIPSCALRIQGQGGVVRPLFSWGHNCHRHTIFGNTFASHRIECRRIEY